jgi:methylated-DNA-[protein]-cysteine S-methyltransferase
MRFSEKVLELTKKIPSGRITTYKIIAEKLNTKAYRAVGTALHKNKRPIVIPCHRIVNSNGFIGGYGGGVRKKIRLLEKEGIKIKNKKIKNFEKVLFKF